MTPKTLFKNTLSFFLNHKKTILLVLIVVGGGYYYYRSSTALTPVRYVYGRIVSKTIEKTVDGTGNVVSANAIDIVTESSGKLLRLYVAPGTTVSKGDLVAELDHTDARIALEKAKNSLLKAQLSLGASQTALKNAETEQGRLVLSALVNLNSSVVAIPDSLNYSKEILSISGTYNATETGAYILTTYNCSSGVCYNVSGLDGGDTTKVDINTSKPLGKRGLYLKFSSTPIGNDKWIIKVPSPESSLYYANNKAYSDALETQRTTLESKNADILSSQVSLSDAQIGVDTAQRDLEHTYVRAPFTGKIGKVSVTEGQVVGSNVVLASLGAGDLKANIELNEIDAAKVSLGQDVLLTFDALPGLSLTGKVSSIDNEGTVTSGVVLFKVEISFSDEKGQIKSGMSVASSLVIDKKEGALVVPLSAIKSEKGQSYIDVVQGERSTSTTPTLKKTYVTVGITTASEAEVTGDIHEGDSIVVRVTGGTVKTTTATTQAQGATTNRTGQQRTPGSGAILRAL